MKYLKSLVATLILSAMFFSATPALAFSVVGNNNCAAGSSTCVSYCGQAHDSAVCTDKATSIAGPDGLLSRITLVVAVIAGIAAIVVIILSGLRYVTSSGDPKNVESAKNTLIGAIIGLAVVVAAEFIVRFVVSQL